MTRVLAGVFVCSFVGWSFDCAATPGCVPWRFEKMMVAERSH